jgi:hypothetical protein
MSRFGEWEKIPRLQAKISVRPKGAGIYQAVTLRRYAGSGRVGGSDRPASDGVAVCRQNPSPSGEGRSVSMETSTD